MTGVVQLHKLPTHSLFSVPINLRAVGAPIRIIDDGFCEL